MATTKEMEYVCPYCGQTFPITIYDSVNVRDEEEMKEAVKSGDLFRHLCPHCDTNFMIQNPFVYFDPDNQFILWLCDEEPPESLQEIAKPFAEKGFTLRRCETIQELVEKIEIFEDGMNDVLVELAKYDSFIEYIDNHQGKADEVTSVEYQSCKEGVLKINVRSDDKGMSFLIPIEGLEEELRAQADRFQVENALFPAVNGNWIISLFQGEETVKH